MKTENRDQTTDEQRPPPEQEEEAAREEMKAFEERDEVPTDLSEWPSGKAKFLTYDNENDDAFGDGLTGKLGPGSLERHEDGSISVDGEKVDNPDDYKADPIPGGPTDPNAPALAGEKRREEQ